MDYMQNSIFDGNSGGVPLADRVRPRSLDEFVGQDHILGRGKLLRQLIESDNITSMILWGPPGVGKTTIAMVIANMTNAEFITFSAVTSSIKEIKDIMKGAEESRYRGKKTVIFIDEIHRFNKAQQDAFLPHVEKGNIILIGATTENPSFQVNSALLSRSKVFVLHSLEVNDIVKILKNALQDDRGLKRRNVSIDDELLETIAVYSNGDGRAALNTLEMAAFTAYEKSGKHIVSREIVDECIQRKSLLYDKNGEEHYNLISALHKSMRNSDPDASVYWLARMLEAGEDPLYIARRVIRFSSEDVGLADPKALQIAVAAYDAVHYIGMPECSVNLAQAVVYMAIAPKSNALYMAYENAKKDAVSTIAQGVPLHLRNAPTRLMDELGYGKGYKYAHDFDIKVTDMECLPENLRERVYYKPAGQGFEKNIKERIEYIKDLKSKRR
jgi:ATPase related to the helicase subunit of the Holliday junction resolvase